MITKPFVPIQWDGYCAVKARLIMWQVYAAVVATVLLVLAWTVGDFSAWWILAPTAALSLKVAADMVGVAALALSGWLE